VSTFALGRSPRSPLTIAMLLAMVPAGMLVAQAPFVSSGVFFGVILIATVLVHPLAIIGAMLLLGPIDLSFLTGGFKSLLEAAGGLDMSGIRLIGVAGGLGVTALVFPTTRRVLFGPYGIAYAAFLLWSLMTLAISPGPVDGLRLWLKIAYPFLFFVVIAGVTTERWQLDRLMDFALVGTAFVAGLSITDYSGGIARLHGIVPHENPFSFYLMIGIYMSFGRFATRGQLRYLVLCIVLGIWMILTRTRITFLATAVGMLGIGVYAAFAARNLRMLGAAVALGLLIAIPLTPMVMERSLGYVPSVGELVSLARSPLALYEAINWQGRELAWPIVFAAFLGQPWTGLGMGASTVIMRENFPPQVGLVVHNDYLRLAADTGIIGVLLFAAAVIMWGVAVIRADRRSAGAAREFTLPAIAGLISWCIIAITDNIFDYYSPFTQFLALLVAASMAAAAIHEREQHHA
jgi:O-antigen ligase